MHLRSQQNRGKNNTCNKGNYSLDCNNIVHPIEIKCHFIHSFIHSILFTFCYLHICKLVEHWRGSIKLRFSLHAH